MLSVRAVLRLAAASSLALVAACADSTSPPAATPGSAGPVRLECTADVAARAVRCAEPGAGGAHADRIVGQGGGVKLTSSNVAVFADTFAFDVTVTNQLEYPIGTTDGVNAAASGIRPFFYDGVHTTGGTGAVTVANADGVGTFTATGQPYFRYSGVLAPGATTAARRWKLRFDPRVQTFSFTLYISTPVPPGGGTVYLRILDPTANTVFSDSVLVDVKVDSAPASIQSVKAFVEDRSVTLLPSQDVPGTLTGKLSLVGLAYGSHQIRVHAVTVRADTGNAYVTITKDAPPTLTVTLPTTNQVARPNLRIDADCVDDNPAGCASITASASGAVLASGTGGIHADVSLAAENELQLQVFFLAKDSRGRQKTLTVPVYVQTGAALTFVDSAGTQALDLDATRLLFADTVNTVWTRDRASGTRTALQASSYGNVYGRLFPLGALFGRKANGQLYEYRGGTVADVSVGASGLVVKGSWAAWSNSSLPGVGRRDLAAGATEFVGGGAAHPDVGPNGDLVYDYLGKVYRYRTFPAGEVVDSGGATSPVTDGINIVYQKGFLMRFDGTASTVLTTSPAGSTPHTYYEVNAGWIAYAVLDFASQLRVRAPDGTDTQVTASTSGNLIRALGPDGTLVYARSGVLYALRAPYTAIPTRLGKDWFTARFNGTDLLLFLGNTVFQASY